MSGKLLNLKSHNVGIDFHVFDGKFQGSRSHLIGIYSELTALCPEIHFFFFLEKVDELRRIDGFNRSNVELIHMPHSNSLVRLGWQLPRLRRKLKLDLLHTQYIIPFWPAHGNAVTIHDVLFESFPEYFSPLFVIRSRLLMRYAARKADLLFSVSKYSQHEISSLYGVDASKIGVLLNAVDHESYHPGKDGKETLLTRGLTAGGYFLTVGRIEPRKNHAMLLRAYNALGENAPPLVIIGQRDFGCKEFEKALKSLPNGNRVMLFSDIDDRELPILYRNAMAFVYPSMAEGFGMPPLEAMASGVPVIVSNTTAIPEVVGEAGILINPDDENSLTQALQQLMTDDLLRSKLATRGRERALEFTWLAAAQVLAQSYRDYFSA